jgi:threonine synthase
MKFYSTKDKNHKVSLQEAVIKGLAPNNGLFLPEKLPVLPASFFQNMHKLSLQEVSLTVAKAIFGEDVPEKELQEIVYGAMSFPIPLEKVKENLYSLELFHGPTLAFKDVGAGFMSRLLRSFLKNTDKEVYVLVATSGDTGSAVANGFYDVPGIKVVVLYPSGLVSEIQEKQFTTLGKNITAVEIEGTFDDCQRLVKQAFNDAELNQQMMLTSANSINLARFIPQSFYYFWGWAQMPDKSKPVVISVPSGNFGNLTAAVVAKKMGLPVEHFIAATNANDIVPNYLKSGNYEPRPSVSTVANAMDVGDPNNFPRLLELYGSYEAISADISGYSYTDEEVLKEIREVKKATGYLLDPHGAIGFKALDAYLSENPGKQGFFIETAHPAKFKETVESTLKSEIEIPAKLQEFMKGTKQSVVLSKEFEDFKAFLKKQ